jgi:ubiquinone/menaquinone biosynthesis C-methylase UbiE
MSHPASHAPETAPARIGQAEAARLYDRLAPIYDAWGLLTESRSRERALAFAAVRDGERLLEVAAGTGLAFRELVARNPNGHNLAIDISAGMLARARQRLARAGLSNYAMVIGSALELPAADASFDLLVNNYMFDLIGQEHWPRILGEFQRVLAPGGRLVLVNMTHGERPGSRLYDRIYRLSPGLMGGCRGVALSASLQAAGFEVLRREYVQQCLFPSEVLLANRAGSGQAPGERETQRGAA